MSPLFTENRSDAPAAQGGWRMTFGLLLGILLVSHPLAALTQHKFFYLIGAATGGAAFMYAIARGRLDLSPLLRSKAIYLLLLLPFFSVLWSRYPAATSVRALHFSVFIVVYYFAHTSLYVGRREWLYGVCQALSYLFVALSVGIMARYGAVRANSKEMAAIFGSFAGNSAAAAVLCLPFLLANLFRGKARLLGVGAIPACVAVVLLSQSRGAYLMLVAAAFLMCILFSRDWRTARRNALATVALLAVMALFVGLLGYKKTIGPALRRVHASQLPRLLTGERPIRRASSDYKRAMFYYGGLEIIRGYPLTGIGYGAVKQYLISRYGVGSVSHNLIVTIWGELGLFGLVVFGWAAISAMWRCWRARQAAIKGSPDDFYFYSAALVAFMIAVFHGQFRPMFTQPMFFVVLAALASAPRRPATGATPIPPEARAEPVPVQG